MTGAALHRRALLLGGAAALAARRADAALQLNPALPAGTREIAILEALPGKQKLIKLAWRPPNYETPLAAFAEPITPNDLFFVRYHLSVVPDEADLADWSLTVSGPAAERTLRFTLDELKALPAAEITAVCQCSGNRRGLFNPHVPGVQWGSGAMGDAVWRGVRLRDVLTRAGVRPNAVEVAFRGADGPPLDSTPPFRKSLPLERALDGNVMLAWAMNGGDLPIWNGFPVRLIVPGWTGTYWMKHLTQIEVRDTPLDNIWMRKAYRVPRGMFPIDLPFTTQDDAKTSPITEIVVNTLITAPADGAEVAASGFELRGLAWDRGHGIARVEVSADAGATWREAELGADLGRFAFRPFTAAFSGLAPGKQTLRVRATSPSGETQPDRLRVNPAGYHDNTVQSVSVTVA